MRTFSILAIFAGVLGVAACGRAIPGDAPGERQFTAASESATQRGQSNAVAAARPTKKDAAKMKHVKAGVYLATDLLQAGQTQRFAVVIDIAPGWHINTNPAHPSYVIPTSVKIPGKKKARGKQDQKLSITAINYPRGSKLAIPGMKVPMMVYDGRVIFFGDLQVPKAFTGEGRKISFALTYQICNDRQCLAPKTVTLTGIADAVPAGEAVQQINQEVFKKDPQRDTSRR